MILTPPFSLSGEAGKALGLTPYSLAALGITDATLKLCSMDAGVLQFSLRDNGTRPVIPDDNQWLTLKDNAGQVLFTGLAKRSFRFPQRVYIYEVSDVYKGLGETPLKGNDGRPYLVYPTGDLRAILLDLLGRAQAAGLPIKAPTTVPILYQVPKMAFRSATYAAALEDAMKWAPDLATRMDYSTTPPTLRFYARSSTAATSINLGTDGHACTAVLLTPAPEQRALAVSFAYAKRTGANTINLLTQTAGNDNAEAHRKISLFLSGSERTDVFVSEALTTAQKAISMASAAITAVGQDAAATLASVTAQIDAKATAAPLAMTFENLLARDSNLQAARVAQPGFLMGLTSFSATVYVGGMNCGTGNTIYYQASYGAPGVTVCDVAGSPAAGWYPIVTGAFTAAELATAGATKATRYFRGSIYVVDFIGGAPGFNSLPDALCHTLTGYTQSYTPNCADCPSFGRQYGWYSVNVAVDAINKSPSAVAAAVKAAAQLAANNQIAAANSYTSFLTRGEFVEAPDNLAQNYFARQDWIAFKGSADFAPSVPSIPLPGDFLNFLGEGCPQEWATMAAPVAHTEINLATREVQTGIGPSPRQDFQTLTDRLRIPAEDNYEPG